MVRDQLVTCAHVTSHCGHVHCLEGVGLGFLLRLMRDICNEVFCISHSIVLTGKTIERYTEFDRDFYV